jgi:hypothetical protein
MLNKIGQTSTNCRLCESGIAALSSTLHFVHCDTDKIESATQSLGERVTNAGYEVLHQCMRPSVDIAGNRGHRSFGVVCLRLDAQSINGTLVQLCSWR